MAVYTELADEELTALLAQYDLGQALSLKGIAEGVENTNYLLETTAGRYILTIYEKRVARADLPFFMAVMEHLAAAGLPCPRPALTRAGSPLAEVRAKACAVIGFLSGLSPKRPSAAQCASVGRALAQMHSALATTAQSRPNTLGPADWEALVRPRLAQAEALRPGLRQAVAADLDAVNKAWPQGLPRGVIHADLFPDNVLFTGDTVSGLIDFYFACSDFLAYDLAVCLNAWCFEGDRSFNLTKGQRMIAGYESVRPLTPGERDALPILARGAALRFFSTRLADWSATPEGALVKPKHPLEYADRLAFHARANGFSDYGG